MGTDLFSKGEDGGSAALGLREYLDVLRRRKWVVVLVLAVCVGAAVGISEAQQKKYEATTKIVVGQGKGLIPSAYSNAVQPYTATMADLVKPRPFYTLPGTLSPREWQQHPSGYRWNRPCS